MLIDYNRHEKKIMTILQIPQVTEFTEKQATGRNVATEQATNGSPSPSLSRAHIYTLTAVSPHFTSRQPDTLPSQPNCLVAATM
jgi:hypothetical protein